MTTSSTPNFATAFRGSFTSALRWHHLDALWEALKSQPGDDWYIYAIGQAPPDTQAERHQLHRFIAEIDSLLHREHTEDYCGIVYADNLQHPTFIKIYDPHNLGVSCGYSDNPPLPGWVLSKLQPIDLEQARPMANNRKHWWSKLFE